MKTCVWCKNEYIDETKRQVGKTCSSKCARELGVAKRRVNGSYARTDAMNAKTSVSLKRAYATGERSSWVTPEHLEKMHNANRGVKPDHWSKTSEARAALSARRKGWNPTLATRTAMSLGAQKRLRNKRETLHTSACGGHRPDLGMYFRSRWEANFARILTYQGKEWGYEPVTFRLTPTMSYTPDFVCEGTCYELKGRWYKGQAEKVAMFREKHPELPLVIIEEAEYRELSKQYKMLIQNWEGK